MLKLHLHMLLNVEIEKKGLELKWRMEHWCICWPKPVDNQAVNNYFEIDNYRFFYNNSHYQYKIDNF